ncbi:MAG: EAL domain-containing protein, partial [Epulopiscium sp.]|nr:EAL domain-containing protein [Candidatus Epulonipiscium sp.]
RSDKKTFETKKRKAEAWGAQIALDDFGSGYNTESSLLYMSPDYIKLDMSIIHGVDKDINRRNLLSSILSYTKPRNIITIAEGIETKEEMETVLELGVDLLQGFYIAKPDLEVKQIPEKIKKEIIEISKNRLS